MFIFNPLPYVVYMFKHLFWRSSIYLLPLPLYCELLLRRLGGQFTGQKVYIVVWEFLRAVKNDHPNISRRIFTPQNGDTKQQTIEAVRRESRNHPCRNPPNKKQQQQYFNIVQILPLFCL